VFLCQNSFRFDNVQQRIHSKAPYLLDLFHNLASRRNVRTYKTAANERGEADDGWVDEEILDDSTMDMDLANAYVDTEMNDVLSCIRMVESFWSVFGEGGDFLGLD